MKVPENFCGFKTAYLLPIKSEWSDSITGMICDSDSTIWTLDDYLPDGWVLKATYISVLAGFILEFEMENPPTAEECQEVEKAIMAFGQKHATKEPSDE